MNWEEFLSFLSLQESSSLLNPILRNARILSDSETTLTLSCDNLGIKIYIDNKRKELEEYVEIYTGTKKSIVTLVEIKGKKKAKTIEREELPIITYPSSLQYLLEKACLQERFTFENFAVSNSNQIAHAAAMAVADSPSNQYNPLFFYGGVGVGKTHLMHAIGIHILQKNPEKKILYCTSEEFTNDLIDLIRKKDTTQFRKKYRSMDVLIIDDAQFIAGKTYIQEEFYHTFNTIVKNGGQVVLSSDRHPNEIKELEDRLRSRFTGGLIIDIQNPDFELRTAILLIKAKERNIPIDIEAAKKLAERQVDARSLEGLLLQIYSKSLLLNSSTKITTEMIDSEAEKQQQQFIKSSSPNDVIKHVCLYFDVKVADLKGPSRKSELAYARQVAMYVMRVVLRTKLDEIAFFLKRKDHTTILHGVDKIADLMMKDQKVQTEVDAIIHAL